MRNMFDWLMRHRRFTFPLAAAGLALGVWLFFGFFGFHTLFFDEVVDEAPPAFTAGPGASGMEGDEIDEEMAEKMSDAMAEGGIPAEAEVDEAPMADPLELAEGMFIDRSHPTRGRAVVLGDAGGQRFVRFEDFVTDNGPDLNVYLSTAPPDAPATDFDEDFVDLGDLKGNVGSQNYEIPTDVDLDRYRTVVIWCVRFGVVFGAAPLDA